MNSFFHKITYGECCKGPCSTWALNRPQNRLLIKLCTRALVKPFEAWGPSWSCDLVHRSFWTSRCPHQFPEMAMLTRCGHLLCGAQQRNNQSEQKQAETGFAVKSNLWHLFIKVRGKGQGAKGNLNLHRVNSWRQGALSGSSCDGGQRQRETDTGQA